MKYKMVWKNMKYKMVRHLLFNSDPASFNEFKNEAELKAFAKELSKYLSRDDMNTGHIEDENGNIYKLTDWL